ncbi:MAG: YopX family protein [Acutalibacteraceae bacterium]
MRKILFRGKHLNNGEWEYGYYCFLGPAGKEKHFIIPTSASAFYGIEIDPLTLGQFTGLTDKNGKRIFEGDNCKVVQFDSNNCEYRSRTFLMEWIESGFGLYSRNDDDELVIFLGIGDTEDVEIIGNIHDNPELIKNA